MEKVPKVWFFCLHPRAHSEKSETFVNPNPLEVCVDCPSLPGPHPDPGLVSWALEMFDHDFQV